MMKFTWFTSPCCENKLEMGGGVPYVEKHSIHSSFADKEALIVEDCIDEFIYGRLGR